MDVDCLAVKLGLEAKRDRRDQDDRHREVGVEEGSSGVGGIVEEHPDLLRERERRSPVEAHTVRLLKLLQPAGGPRRWKRLRVDNLLFRLLLQ